MSSNGAENLWDLHELPGCAPGGLKAMFAFGEEIIQNQVELLGSGKPSEAPDPAELLRGEGISNPDDRGELVDNYSEHKDGVEGATTGLQEKNDDVFVRTTGIGEVVTNAYGTIETSVNDLNDKIDEAEGQKRPIINEDGNALKDQHGNRLMELPPATINDLFNGLWETLNTVHDKVSNVSDQAAAEALNISDDEPTYPTTNPGGNTNPGGAQPASYTPTGSGGGEVTPVSGTGSMGTAIIPTEDKPDAMAMMKYLIKEHNFTPAQAAGIVANARYESHFDVGATGDDGTAHGLFQWRFDRHEGLKNYAVEESKDIGDWRTHIDYMVTELRGGDYEKANNVVSNSTDERAVAEAFDWHYERSSGHTTDDRREYAAGVLDEWNKSNSGATDLTVAV